MSLLKVLGLSWLLASGGVLAQESITAQGEGQAALRWPLDSEPGISSTFGEFRRGGRYHMGLDIKTWGVYSRPCFAVADGWVSRVKVQSDGYGKALYLTLEDGRVAVYAHLDRFAQPIAHLVRLEQERRGEYEVDLYWDKDSAVVFKAGEVVAFSGVSGTNAPHLHFELRRGYQVAENPLGRGLWIPDHTPPQPQSIALTPLNPYATIEGDHLPRIWEGLLKNPQGEWELSDPIAAKGEVGVSVEAYDQTDNATNAVAVFGVELWVNGEMRWKVYYDAIPYDQMYDNRLERDYRLYRRGWGTFHRLWRTSGNNLSFCQGDGVIDAGRRDPFPVRCVIKLYDRAGNTSILNFTIIDDDPSDTIAVSSGKSILRHPNGNFVGGMGIDFWEGYLRFSGPPGVKGFQVEGGPYLKATELSGLVYAIWVPPAGGESYFRITAIGPGGKTLSSRELKGGWVESGGVSAVIVSRDGGCSVRFNSSSVGSRLWVYLERESNFESPGAVEQVYRLLPDDQPLTGSAEITIQFLNHKIDRRGWGLFRYVEGQGWRFLSREGEHHSLMASITEMGRYGLVRDTTPPELRIKSPVPGQVIAASQVVLKAQVNDPISGVVYQGIQVKLDGRKVPAEFDAPRREIKYQPLAPPAPGEHEFELKIVDRMGNEVKKKVTFKVN